MCVILCITHCQAASTEAMFSKLDIMEILPNIIRYASTPIGQRMKRLKDKTAKVSA